MLPFVSSREPLLDEALRRVARSSRLKSAAELLVLRHDTLKLIDGTGPDTFGEDRDGAEPARAYGTEQKTILISEQQNTTKLVETAKEQMQTSPSPKCAFSGVVSIDLKRFADSSIALVECPDCSRTRSLSPVKGVLRFHLSCWLKMWLSALPMKISPGGSLGDHLGCEGHLIA